MKLGVYLPTSKQKDKRLPQSVPGSKEIAILSIGSFALLGRFGAMTTPPEGASTQATGGKAAFCTVGEQCYRASAIAPRQCSKLVQFGVNSGSITRPGLDQPSQLI
jgi:hypothetical protein